jgi:hypothetical protein
MKVFVEKGMAEEFKVSVWSFFTYRKYTPVSYKNKEVFF